jgi:hypothetical protein
MSPWGSDTLAINGIDQTRLIGPGGAYSRFGSEQATRISGDGLTLVVGAPEESSANGKVYIYTRASSTSTSWSKVAELTNGIDDKLGWSVALSYDGSVVVAGVKQQTGVNTDLAPIYMWVKPSGGWTNKTSEDYLLRAVNPGGAATFTSNKWETSVAIDDAGETVVLGLQHGFYAVSGQYLAGQAHVFVKPSGGWASTNAATGRLTQNIDHTGISDEHMGRDVEISGDGTVIIANAIYARMESNSQNSCGSVYIWEKPSGGWSNATSTGKLQNPDIWGSYSNERGDLRGDQFGKSIGIDRYANTIVVGAHYEDWGSPNLSAMDSNEGAVYIFMRHTLTWKTGPFGRSTADAKLGPDPKEDYPIFNAGNPYWYGFTFGGSVAISGDGNTIVVGAQNWVATRPAVNHGAVFVFEIPPNGYWVSTRKSVQRLHQWSPADNDYFGERVSTNRNGDAIAACHFNYGQTLQPFRGAVYVFGAWNENPGVSEQHISGRIAGDGDGITITDNHTSAFITRQSLIDVIRSLRMEIATLRGWEIIMHTSGEKAAWGGSGNDPGSSWAFGRLGTAGFQDLTPHNTGASKRTAFGQGEGLYNAFFTKRNISKIALVSGTHSINSPELHSAHIIYTLDEDTGDETLYSILNRLNYYNRTNNNWANSDGQWSSKTSRNFTNDRSGLSSTYSGNIRDANGNVPTKFAVWAVNEDGDNDVQVLVSYSGTLTSGNGKGDAFRGNDPKHTYWSYWGHDWHSNSTSQTIDQSNQTNPGVPPGVSSLTPDAIAYSGPLYLIAM